MTWGEPKLSFFRMHDDLNAWWLGVFPSCMAFLSPLTCLITWGYPKSGSHSSFTHGFQWLTWGPPKLSVALALYVNTSTVQCFTTTKSLMLPLTITILVIYKYRTHWQHRATMSQSSSPSYVLEVFTYNKSSNFRSNFQIKLSLSTGIIILWTTVCALAKFCKSAIAHIFIERKIIWSDFVPGLYSHTNKARFSVLILCMVPFTLHVL